MAQVQEQNADMEQRKNSMFSTDVKKVFFGALALGAIIGGIFVLGMGALGILGGLALFGFAAACVIGAIKSRVDMNTGLVDYGETKHGKNGLSQEIPPDPQKSQQPQQTQPAPQSSAQNNSASVQPPDTSSPAPQFSEAEASSFNAQENSLAL